MKFIHKILRFTQFLAALVLIAGYLFYDKIWAFVAEYAPQFSFVNFADTFIYLIIGVVASIPVRYVVEKIIESKFML